MTTSFGEIFELQESICPHVEPQIGISITKQINAQFMRGIQLGLPPSLALCFQYQGGRKNISAAMSVDGSVQGTVSYLINRNWNYSVNAMCSPAPDSLKVKCFYLFSFLPNVSYIVTTFIGC